jgi:hypothetical protein
MRSLVAVWSKLLTSLAVRGRSADTPCYDRQGLMRLLGRLHGGVSCCANDDSH